LPSCAALCCLLLLTAGYSDLHKPVVDSAADRPERITRGKDPPPVEEFRVWAKANVHPIAVDDTASRGIADLRPFGQIVGQARVVALSEPFHGGREPLALRNRLIRYLVIEKGFTAVALETGLAQSKPLYDYVLGDASIPDSTLRASFTYGFGDLPENLELLKWLRAYNAKRPLAARVRVYGIDLPGQIVGSASPALGAVLDYLDRTDPEIGATVRQQLVDVLPVFSARRYVSLSRADQDMVAAKVRDLVALLRRSRPAFAKSSSRDEYEWALRQAVNADQDLSLMRLLTPEFFQGLDKGSDALPRDLRQPQARNAREDAMAENLAWVLEREGPHGRIVTFAHDLHQQGHVVDLDPGMPWEPWMGGVQPAGMYARAMFGADLVTVGTYFGSFQDTGTTGAEQADPESFETLLGSLGLSAFVTDLRAVRQDSTLGHWLSQSYRVRAGEGMEHFASPLKAYDAVVYIDRISPVSELK
jgi:erythromycin esterase